MNIMYRLRRLLPVLAIVGLSSLVVACSSRTDARSPDGSVRVQTVANDPALGSTATVVVVDAQGIDPATGRPGGEFRRDIRVFQGQSLATVATAALLGGVAPAAVQGFAGYHIAQQQALRCARGGCGGGGATAISISGAEATAGGYAGINFGSPSGH